MQIVKEWWHVGAYLFNILMKLQQHVNRPVPINIVNLSSHD